MGLTITDAISGEPVVIERPLLADHINVGQMLWYKGYTSISGWDCPAIITSVDGEKKRFRVRSLDDMRVQDQWYEFSISEYSPYSRLTMRVVEREEVQAYLEQRRTKIEQVVSDAKESLQKAQATLERFDRVSAMLII